MLSASFFMSIIFGFCQSGSNALLHVPSASEIEDSAVDTYLHNEHNQFDFSVESISTNHANVSRTCDFITTWQTTNPNEEIVLSMTGSINSVDWGDGTVNMNSSHVYVGLGEYTITVSGDITSFTISPGHNDKILSY